VLYPIVYANTRVVTVVGHTGCGALTAALDAVQHGGIDAPPGVSKRVEMFVPTIEAGLADDRIDPEHEASPLDQLVEYNVDRQVSFLLASEDVPDDAAVYGFVYDFQGVYGATRGRTHLVNAEGETDVDALRELVPGSFVDHVRRLL